MLHSFSQSGTMGISMLESADLFGLSKMISFGNRSDVDEADMIWYAANDPQTKVIGLYMLKDLVMVENSSILQNV